MIKRPESTIPVWGEYDVAVAGGGVAGVAAALAAARQGAKVCLLEKYAGLGGLATMGHVIVYLPLCDGRGRQVSFGIAEELLKLPMQYSACKPNGAWAAPSEASNEDLRKTRYELRYDPGPMSIGLDAILEEAGVEIIYDTLVVDVAKASNGAITHLVVENKTGCGAFAVQAVIDCTGEADICHLCGEETETATKNVRSAWYYAVDEERKLTLGYAVDEYWKVDEIPEMKRFDGTDWRSISRQIIESRKLIVENVAHLNEKRQGTGLSKLYPFYAPYFHGFRMTRHLVSDYVMTPVDLHQWHEDTVGIFSDWRKPGPVYSLPLRTLLAVKTPNLATAGRCISSTGDTWDITRVIPVCAVSGEAAGTVAAMAVASGCALRELPIDRIQSTLVEQGVVLDPALVKEAPSTP